ncbi:eCIS core domain-containing protein [Pseudomonas shirazensis]
MTVVSKNNNPHSNHTTPSRDKSAGSFFGVQAKLNIGKSNDKYEAEADKAADKVVSQNKNTNPEPFFTASPIVQNKKAKELQKENVTQEITPVVQSKIEKEESIQNKPDSVTTENAKDQEKNSAPKPLIQKKKKEEDIQAKEEDKIQKKEDDKKLQMSAGAAANPSDSSNLENTLQSSKGSGSPLSGQVKNEMESGFGTDFSNVKIHNDSTAVQMNQQLGSQAFANGSDVYFNKGKYNPESQSGKHLLAHELTHTIQQGASKPMVQKMEQSNLQIQKDEEQDVTAVKIDVNRVGDMRFNDVLNNFNNAISLFQNWYFDKDEADQTFYNEASQIIRNASSIVSDIATPIGGRLAGAFGYAAEQLGLNRFEFITSLTLVNGGFNQMVNEHFIGKTATILEGNTILWGTIVEKYSNQENWLDSVTQAGLPPASNSNLQQQLLSRLVFAYRRWELQQHSAMYQGIYALADPNLEQMQAGADADAASLIAHPTMNLGDVIFSLPDYTLLERMTMDPIAQTYTIGQAGFSVPLFEGLGVALNGGLTAGYNIGGYFGGIKLTNLQFGFNYAQTPIMFDALALALPLGGLNALKAISLLYNSRFRLTGMLEIPTEIYGQMFIEAALGIGLEVGLSTILSANVAGIDGSLRAEGNARFGAFFGAPVDIIISGGQMSFSHAASLELKSSVGFDIIGGIHAHFLTLDWERTWNIASWRWDQDWMFNSNMNLIYINGIQGDPKNVINVQNFIHAVSQLNNLGSQIMNMGPTGNNSGPAAGPPPMPNPRGHLDLIWPKPRSAAYPPLYLTHNNETRSQRTLKDLHDEGDPTVEKFKPHDKKFLPGNEAEIGIDPEYQIALETSVGPLDENAQTPGGDKMNSLVRDYGIKPAEQQGDHVYEIQVGGHDIIQNMWPLDAHINTSGGSRLSRAEVTEAATGHIFKIDFLKAVMRRHGHVTYMFIIKGFN